MTPRVTPTPAMDRTSLDHVRRRQTEEDFSDNLEDEQTGRKGRDRRKSEGTEGGLTELAIPDLVDRHYLKKDSLEQQQSNVERHNSADSSSDDPDAGLTELAVPEPVETFSEEEETGPQDVDEEKAEDPSSSRRRRSHVLTEFYTISWLIFFSLLGTLARLGVESLTRYPSAPISTVVLWANLGGSLILGFLTEDRRLFREEYGASKSPNHSFRKPSDNTSITPSMHERAGKSHSKVKKTIPLFVGLATGFCGSFTSFSSFMRDAFLALSNDLAPPPTGYPFTSPPIHTRNGGYSFMAVLAILILHPTISLGALKFGAHLALAADPILPTLPFRLIRRFLDPVAVLLAFGCWLGAVLLTIWPPLSPAWRAQVTLALVFAPPGCLLRFYASRHMNAYVPAFPLGTFAVNIFGTVVIGMCFDLQHSAIGRGQISCAVLEGVMEGFCGCTTTVSTWVAELNGLRRRHGYIYGLTSMGVGLGVLVCIMGGLGWTRGFVAPVC